MLLHVATPLRRATASTDLRDRSSRPHFSPIATHTDVVGKIVYLRQHYHFGPRKISMYLARYHDITISTSGVWRILKRLELNRLPATQRYKPHDRRWKRYEKQLPGHQVQIDVKFIEPIAGATAKKYYQYTAIDDCTRLRVLRIYPTAQPEATAIQFLDYVLEKLPFQVETDPDRQRRRVPIRVPLARARPRHRPRLHQAPHAPTQRQSRAITPHRRRGVLPTPRTASSSTTPSSSTTSSKNGRTSTTSTDPTAASTAKPPTNDYDRRPPGPDRHRPPSVAHLPFR